MKKHPLRFGVIGTSGIANTHLEELRKLADMGEAQIAAVADINETNGKLAAQAYRCDYYQNYQELLGRKDIDVVNVCVPSGLHGEIAIDAALTGKHVIVEKPMDISPAKAEKMIQACKSAGVILSVVMQNRFAPGVRQVKAALQQGMLGRPLLINASVHWFRSQSYYDVSAWRGTWSMDGGGAVMNQGIHTVDLILHLMGNWKNMSGLIDTVGHECIEVEDVAVSVIQFETGALGVFASTTCAYPGFQVRIEIIGSDGSVVLEGNQIVHWSCRSGIKPPVSSEFQQHPHLSLHGLQILDVIHSIQDGRDPVVTGEEGIRSLKFVHHLYQLNKLF